MTEVYSKTRIQGHNYLTYGFETDGSQPPSDVATYTWADTFSGARFPGWRAKVRAHQNATTTCSWNKFEAESSPCLVDMYSETVLGDPRYFKAVGAIAGPVPYFTVGVAQQGDADSDASGAFYGSARRAMSSFQGSVFAAESNQARRMMLDRGRKMLSGIAPYQRRVERHWNRSKTKKAKLKSLADNHLELQFGWAPLISDIKSAYKTLHNPQPQFKRVSGNGTHTQIVSRLSGSFGTGICVVRQEVTESTKYHVKYYGEVRARADPTGSALQDFGLTMREFLPTVLEILPWSFAVDYFTNVSEMVTAASYATADFTWLAKSRRTSRTRVRTSTQELASAWVSKGKITSNIGSRFQGTATAFVREPISSVPVPSLTWELPSFRQGLNLAALAISRRLRLRT